jgi:hypothetical protein
LSRLLLGVVANAARNATIAATAIGRNWQAVLEAMTRFNQISNAESVLD